MSNLRKRALAAAAENDRRAQKGRSTREKRMRDEARKAAVEALAKVLDVEPIEVRGLRPVHGSDDRRPTYRLLYDQLAFAATPVVSSGGRLDGYRVAVELGEEIVNVRSLGHLGQVLEAAEDAQ